MSQKTKSIQVGRFQLLAERSRRAEIRWFRGSALTILAALVNLAALTIPVVSAEAATHSELTLSGGARLSIKGFGRVREAVNVSATLAPDGSWTAIDNEGFQFEGSYRRNRNRARFVYSAKGLDSHRQQLEQWVSELVLSRWGVDAPVQVTILRSRVQARIKRARWRVSGKFRVLVSVPSLGLTRRGLYSFRLAGLERRFDAFVLDHTVTGAGRGTVSGASGSSYPAGTGVWLNASAVTGSSFDRWTGCDRADRDRCHVTMNSNRSIVAHFKKASPPPSPPPVREDPGVAVVPGPGCVDVGYLLVRCTWH